MALDPMTGMPDVEPKRGLPDHEIAALLNKLRDVAIRFHDTEQLRDRIANVLVPVLKSYTPAVRPLKVRFQAMPESNGRRNWTVLLAREDGSGLRGDLAYGFQISRSEYHDRERYWADRLRYLIGESTIEPDILNYDANLREPK